MKLCWLTHYPPLQGGTPGAAAADAAEDDPEAELDPAPAPEEPSEEELLTQLGLQLEQRIEQLQTAEGVVPPAVAQRWAAEERRRSRERWQPQRPHSAAGVHQYRLCVRASMGHRVVLGLCSRQWLQTLRLASGLITIQRCESMQGRPRLASQASAG